MRCFVQFGKYIGGEEIIIDAGFNVQIINVEKYESEHLKMKTIEKFRLELTLFV